MKKGLIKILIPITALLLSSCDALGWFNKNILGKSSETNEPSITPEEEPEAPKYDGYPTSISLPNNVPLTIGQTKSLSVTYEPETTTHKEVKWATSDKSVATVIDGQVTGVGKGNVTITASTLNNEGNPISSECNLIVTDPSEISKTKLLYTYDDYVSHNYYTLSNCPLKGNPKLLVLPIWFNNSDEFISDEKRESVRDDIRLTFFGSNEENGWRSVKTFYEEESKGIVTMGGTVADWYEVNNSYQDFASNAGYSLVYNLVTTASDAYFENNTDVTRKDYDDDNDGYLDAVVLIYGSPDSASLGIYNDNLWAYTSWLQTDYNKTEPVPNVFFWGSYDFMYSFGSYALKRTGIATYGRGDTKHCVVDSHCYIHEMGHILGLPDYYDYSGMHSPAGGFSMQDSNVGGHDAFSVTAYGWAQPYIPKESMTITINDFQLSHDVIILANHDVNSPFDEYLMLELYTPTGLNFADSVYQYRDSYPQGPLTTGIRLWHVDARLTYLSSGSWSKTLTTNAKHSNVTEAMTNTTYYEGIDMSTFPLGIESVNYNFLELIRNKEVTETLTADALFGLGSSFELTSECTQFVKSGNMNDGNKLGWKFSVDAMDSSSATITVTKL